MSEPQWLKLARGELGTTEIVGSKHNPKVVQYFRDVHNSDIDDDETPWCAAFIGAMLERSGIVSTRKLNARSYLAWGANVDKSPKAGDIAIFKRGNSSWQGHVAFFLYEKDGRVHCLGGNQTNKVSIASYQKSVWLGYRRPKVVTDQQIDKVSDSVSLAMEKIGAHRSAITLSEYAAWIGNVVTEENTVLIRGNRDAMTGDAFTGIVSKNYWVPTAANMLPEKHATFVLDTALEHGPHKTRLMMQQASGAKADGIIGPKSVAAIKKMKDVDFIEAMTKQRIADYKTRKDWDIKLPEWTQKMTAIRNKLVGPASYTETISKSEPPTAVKITVPKTTTITEKTMTTAPTPIEESKAWTQSLTVWGTIVTFVSAVLPSLGALFGWTISPGDVQAVGTGVTEVIQAVGGVIGTVMALVGRMQAKVPVKLFG
jgi:uncharacterized protein (TIGR02594 family)